MLRRPILFLLFLLLPATTRAASPPDFLFSISQPIYFNQPTQIVQRSDGRIYIAGGYTHDVRVFGEGGALLSTFATPVSFSVTGGIAFDAQENIYVSDQLGNRIVKYSPTHAFIMTFGEGLVSYPTNLGMSPDGSVLYVAEFGGDRVSMFDTDGVWLGSFGTSGSGPGEFDLPWGLAVASNGNVYVSDQGNDRIQVFSPSGSLLAIIGSPGIGPGQFDAPVGMAFDPDDHLYVCDQLNNRVQKFNAGGAFLTSWGGGFSNNWAVGVTQLGRIWVSDTYNYRIQVFQYSPTPAAGQSWGGLKAKYGR